MTIGDAGPDYGNTGYTSVPLALWQAREEGRTAAGYLGAADPTGCLYGPNRSGRETMRKLRLRDAFERYGATPINIRWAMSAVAEDGSIVLSLWSHHFHQEGEVLRYTDSLSRWVVKNPARRDLFAEHLAQARDGRLPIRLIIAKADDPLSVSRGGDASTKRKTFKVRPDLTGEVTHFDGDEVVIDFRKS